MLSRCHGIFVVLCVGLEVSRASSTGNGVRCTLNSVGLMLLLPEMTHQWSLLGLNLWSNRGASKATSNEQDINQWSSRVLNFFPVPVEEECLSEDKRRQGICMNTYECRIQHGVSHGPCALGFGVCCIFTASCDNEVQNNLTYVTSPGFPNLIDRPMNCTVVVRKIDTEVSQLRIDFVHFNIGQPNAMTGVCDGDVMVINNGRSSFELCGWNSGQHVYVDASEGNEPITLDFRLPSGLQSRMWEMRVVQLGFEQRAPVGCLQYFRSPNGTLRTFNYLPNGRYLAGHDHLLCVRQERDMCGIAYQPCTPDSFRIGTGRTNATNVPAAPVTSNGNVSTSPVVDLNSIANNSNADVVEGSGAGSPEQQEMVLTTGTNSAAPAIGTRCRDRILIPCDFEEFITPGNNVAGVCNLEHCGNSLCRRDELDAKGNCRVETWTTPFRIRVAFGPGSNTTGTLADNTGMCLTYQQLACVA
ncbi:CUB domain-containing protein [Camponotus japonicus]